jgi:hypothetical protein
VHLHSGRPRLTGLDQFRLDQFGIYADNDARYDDSCHHPDAVDHDQRHT